MRKITTALVLGTSMALGSTFAFAGGHAVWKVVPEKSIIHFGSIKKEKIGEVHSFTGISGMVAEDGTATLEIDLASVETNIAIRDKRMKRHVFDVKVPATLSAKLDMAALNAIAVGDTATLEVEGKLSLGGVEVPVKTDFLVAHLTQNKVLVTTASMIMLSTSKAGLTAGVDELMKLAKLPSITRVSPVTLRLMFEK